MKHGCEARENSLDILTGKSRENRASFSDFSYCRKFSTGATGKVQNARADRCLLHPRGRELFSVRRVKESWLQASALAGQEESCSSDKFITFQPEFQDDTATFVNINKLARLYFQLENWDQQFSLQLVREQNIRCGKLLKKIYVYP